MHHVDAAPSYWLSNVVCMLVCHDRAPCTVYDPVAMLLGM